MIKSQITFYAILLLIIGILVVVVGRKFGLFRPKSIEEIKEDRENKIIDTESRSIFAEIVKDEKDFKNAPYWLPEYHIKADYMYLIPTFEAKQKAEKIKKAWGVFNDDEEAIFTIFEQTQSKTNVSQIADEYRKLTGKTLIRDLIEKLSFEELATVRQIMKNKREK